MKKILISVICTLYFVLGTKVAFAADEIICPQPYGGGVVCGVHTPVQTGIADNLPLIGTGFIMASGALLYFSKKIKKLEV